ncbi:hypothetical protein BC833DRAFT_626789 [Globomyces pollinis-pini]|nr:hypothetical protein BC833DRAFT_626789 [Globomyces pollinis-pini]
MDSQAVIAGKLQTLVAKFDGPMKSSSSSEGIVSDDDIRATHDDGGDLVTFKSLNILWWAVMVLYCALCILL